MKKLERFINYLVEVGGIRLAMEKAGYASLDQVRGELQRLLKRVEEIISEDNMVMGSVVIHCDGASRGNPGPSSAAAIAYNTSGAIMATRSRKLGKTTNNAAEYESVLLGLSLAMDLGASKVVVKLDSELVVKQLNGEYRIKNERLDELASEVKRLESQFESCEYRHVARAQNAEADKLANDILAGRSD